MAIGRWMKHSLLLGLLLLEANAQVQPPTISREGENFVLTLSGEMESALKRFNPRFKTWKTADYAISVREDFAGEPPQTRTPFALILDANKDGKPDVVLDGHDDRNSLLLCLLSREQDYIVEILNTSDLIVPSEIVDFKNGAKDTGLCYIFSSSCRWTSVENFDPRKTFVFQIVFPQRSDSAGNLVNDGGSISYYFEKGKFIRGDFDPM